MLSKKWLLKPEPNNETVDQLEQRLGIHKSICQLLAQRGHDSFDKAKHFFRPTKHQVNDPMLMKNMDEAVQRIKNAIEGNEKILVYGDYDVDGTTAVAMVYLFFKEYHQNISYYIPDRHAEGYGISFKSIDFAKENNIQLIIALDCGIKAIKEINYAKDKGIDYIICDHHLPGNTIPNGVILNPKQKECKYPFKELSGAGIGFKLIQGFCKKNKIDIQAANENIDLLAVSIGADMVPVIEENRVLALNGIEKLNNKPNVGVRAILTTAKINHSVNMRDIGFTIGPIINAAGRVSKASKAVELLTTSSKDSAKNVSEEVSLDNIDRRLLDKQITKEALSILLSESSHQNKKSTVVYSETWNKGVLGIVCNRIQEHYYRPTIVLTKSGDEYTGSARSVKGFNIYNAIHSSSEVLETFGGHKYAAGLTVKSQNLKKFIRRFEQVIEKTIQKEHLVPTIEIDIELPINEIKNGFFKILNQFEPFGVGNEQPIFKCTSVKVVKGTLRVLGNKHLKMEIMETNNPKLRIPSIAFNQIKHFDYISKGNSFDICYSLEVNQWKGSRTLQANIRDIRKSKYNLNSVQRN